MLCFIAFYLFDPQYITPITYLISTPQPQPRDVYARERNTRKIGQIYEENLNIQSVFANF